MQKQYIIFLKGVDQTKYVEIEDVFDAQILETVNTNTLNTETIIPKYDSIPSVFNGMDSWPKKTNLCCWYCGFTFQTTPVFIPTYVSKNQCGVFGNFCSFSCASGYIKDYHSSSDLYKKNLLNLYNTYTGNIAFHITESPKRYNLQRYGGSYSDQQYIKKIQELESSISKKIITIDRQYVHIKDQTEEEEESSSTWNICLEPSG